MKVQVGKKVETLLSGHYSKNNCKVKWITQNKHLGLKQTPDKNTTLLQKSHSLHI